MGFRVKRVSWTILVPLPTLIPLQFKICVGLGKCIFQFIKVRSFAFAFDFNARFSIRLAFVITLAFGKAFARTFLVLAVCGSVSPAKAVRAVAMKIAFAFTALAFAISFLSVAAKLSARPLINPLRRIVRASSWRSTILLHMTRLSAVVAFHLARAKHRKVYLVHVLVTLFLVITLNLKFHVFVVLMRLKFNSRCSESFPLQISTKILTLISS